MLQVIKSKGKKDQTIAFTKYKNKILFQLFTDANIFLPKITLPICQN